MTEHTKRCIATPSWSIAVPSQFEEINNNDNWQAIADTRCVYVSSMKFDRRMLPSTAAALCASMSETFGQPPDTERIHFTEQSLIGEAELKASERGFELNGVMCVDGCIIGNGR